MRAMTAVLACMVIAQLAGAPAAVADPVLDGYLDDGDGTADTDGNDDHIVGEEMCAIPVRPRPWTVAPLDFGRLR